MTPHVMLHLGLGSFHRAHQAVYLHRLIQRGDSRWTLAGGNTRPDMADTLAVLAARGGPTPWRRFLRPASTGMNASLRSAR